MQFLLETKVFMNRPKVEHDITCCTGSSEGVENLLLENKTTFLKPANVSCADFGMIFAICARHKQAISCVLWHWTFSQIRLSVGKCTHAAKYWSKGNINPTSQISHFLSDKCQMFTIHINRIILTNVWSGFQHKTKTTT